jgi:hypothetical protein
VRKNGVNVPNEHKRLHSFLENNLSVAIFLSQRVSVRELILSSWLFPVKEGEMHDLKHYCVI